MDLKDLLDFAVSFAEESPQRCGREGVAGIKGQEEDSCGTRNSVRFVGGRGLKGSGELERSCIIEVSWNRLISTRYLELHGKERPLGIRLSPLERSNVAFACLSLGSRGKVLANQIQKDARRSKWRYMADQSKEEARAHENLAAGEAYVRATPLHLGIAKLQTSNWRYPLYCYASMRVCDKTAIYRSFPQCPSRMQVTRDP